jgi:integrase
VAQERRGHSTITTMMDIYSHLTAQIHEDAAAKINAAYKAQDLGHRLGRKR